MSKRWPLLGALLALPLCLAFAWALSPLVIIPGNLVVDLLPFLLVEGDLTFDPDPYNAAVIVACAAVVWMSAGAALGWALERARARLRRQAEDGRRALGARK